MGAKFVVLLVFLYFSDIKGLSREGKPGYEYYPQIHGWLKMHQDTVEWLEARINCHNEDAVLVSPWTPEFVSAVNKLQNDNNTPEVLSGALETFPEGIYTDNVKGGPTILVDLERCVVFFANGTTGELSCKEKLPYVCYAPELVPTPATPGFLVTTGATIATGAPAAPEAHTIQGFPLFPPGFSLPNPDNSTTPGAPAAPILPGVPAIPPLFPPGYSLPKTVNSTTAGAPEAPIIPGVPATPPLFPPGFSRPKTVISTTPVTPTPARICGVEFSGYVYSNETGHCYKFHNWTAGWRAANITCVSEGAYLAIINSDTEAQFLKDLFEQYPPEKIEPGFKHWASIGFYLQSDTGVWITVDGQTLEQAGYAKWRHNQPHRTDSRTQGLIDRDGLLLNMAHHIRTPYICEKAPLQE